MLHLADDLRWTALIIWAVKSNFTFISDQGAAALGTSGWINDLLRIRVSLRQINIDDFRDDLSAFFNENGVAFMEIQPFNFICIVQGARFTVVPASCTGFKFATGVTAPVLPTW